MAKQAQTNVQILDDYVDQVVEIMTELEAHPEVRDLGKSGSKHIYFSPRNVGHLISIMDRVPKAAHPVRYMAGVDPLDFLAEQPRTDAEDM